jgi:hypothetical protein
MKKMGRACFERMQAEQKELAERIGKLAVFIKKIRMDNVDSITLMVDLTAEDQWYCEQMEAQLKAMAEYNQILLTRIGYAVQQGIED